MSTRSLSGIANKNDTIRYVYCHYDGYVVGGVGELLLYYFNTVEQVNDLLSGGDLRSIGSDGRASPFSERPLHQRLLGGDSDEYFKTVPNDEYRVGLSDSEYIYLFEPETKTWIYKEYAEMEGHEVTNWKLLAV